MAQVVYNITTSVWYAMKASFGKALKAKEQLTAMHIESYVPMRYEKRKVNGRNSVVQTPAIPNLIFVKSNLATLNEAKESIPYLHNILTKSVEGDFLEPIIVPEQDMVRFMTVVADAQERVRYVDTSINKLIISAGVKVRIKEGRYEGYEGVLCRPKGSRARRVLIDICGLAPVELPAIDIELLEKI